MNLTSYTQIKDLPKENILMSLRGRIESEIEVCERRVKESTTTIEHLQRVLDLDARTDETHVAITEQKREIINTQLVKLRASEVTALRSRLQSISPTLPDEKDEAVRDAERQAIRKQLEQRRKFIRAPLEALLKTARSSPQQLAQALLEPDKNDFTPLELLVRLAIRDRNEDYSEIVRVLLSTIEDQILEPFKYDPKNPWVKRAKEVIRYSFFNYLKPSQLKLTPPYNQALQTLQVFYDYIFERDQVREPSQRFFTVEEISGYTERLMSVASENPDILIELGNRIFLWWSMYLKTIQQEVPVAIPGGVTRPLKLDESSKKMLVLLATCFVVANSGERFSLYGYLMQRADIGSDYKTLSQMIQDVGITPEELDQLLASPLDANLQKQMRTNPSAAIERGELYLWAWRFAIQRNASRDQIANFLNEAITSLEKALYIDDKQFPARAVELLEEIRKELATAQREVAKLKEATVTAQPVDVKAEKKKDEPLSLEDDIDETTVPTMAEPETAEAKISQQLQVKAANAQEWLPILESFKPVVAVNIVLKAKIPADKIEQEKERRRAEIVESQRATRMAALDQLERIDHGEIEVTPAERTTIERQAELQLPPEEIKLTSEEEKHLQQQFQSQQAMQILTQTITAPTGGLPTPQVRVTQVSFRLLETLARSNTPAAPAARAKILELLHQKFGDRQDPQYADGEGPRLPPDPVGQVPQLTALQAMQFLSIDRVFSDFHLDEKIGYAIADFYLGQYLQQQRAIAEQKRGEQKLEVDIRQPRAVADALSRFFTLGVEGYHDREASVALMVEIWRAKMRDPDHIAETLPDVPIWFLNKCSHYEIAKQLKPAEIFTFLKYYITEGNGGLESRELAYLLQQCSKEPGFEKLLFLTVTNSVNWPRDSRFSPSIAFGKFSIFGNPFENDPVATITAFLPMIPDMQGGYHSDPYFFGLFVLENLAIPSHDRFPAGVWVSLETLLSLLKDTKQADALAQEQLIFSVRKKGEEVKMLV